MSGNVLLNCIDRLSKRTIFRLSAQLQKGKHYIISMKKVNQSQKSKSFKEKRLRTYVKLNSKRNSGYCFSLAISLKNIESHKNIVCNIKIVKTYKKTVTDFSKPSKKSSNTQVPIHLCKINFWLDVKFLILLRICASVAGFFYATALLNVVPWHECTNIGCVSKSIPAGWVCRWFQAIVAVTVQGVFCFVLCDFSHDFQRSLVFERHMQ